MAATDLYIAKFITLDDWRGGTRDLNVAKEWIKEGKNVFMFFSSDYFPFWLKSTRTYSPVTSINEIDTDIIIKTFDKDFIMTGFCNVDLLYPCSFFNHTTNTIIDDINIKEIKKIIENGNIIRAQTPNIITAPISAFIDDNIFETYSGFFYIYKPTA